MQCMMQEFQKFGKKCPGSLLHLVSGTLNYWNVTVNLEDGALWADLR